MDSNIKKIIDDLIAADAAFRGREPELEKLIRELATLRPDTGFSEEFKLKLKREILGRAALVRQSYKEEENKLSFTSLNFMKKFNYALGGTLAVLVLLAASFYYGLIPLGDRSNSRVLSSAVEIVPAGEQAFGRLALSEGLQFSGERSQSGGGGVGLGAPPALPEAVDSSKLSEGSSSTMVVPPGRGGGGGDLIYVPTVYKYVYKGEELSVPANQLDVFRRIKSSFSSSEIDGLLNQLNFGLMNLSKFASAKLQSLNLIEDKDFGYSIYVSFDEGSVSISENWQRWQTPDRLCRDEQCYQSTRLKVSDIPSDEALIDISNQFLSDHDISMESYGQPFVQNYWRAEYERMADKSQFYVPDVATVIYPLKINGQEIYDEGGTKTGLFVNVNIRVKRVSGVYQLTSQRYQSSSYPAETDVSRLLKIAEKGGFRYGYNDYPYPGNTRTIEVVLGTPETALVKIWQYKDNRSDELIVPALIFPIIKTPEGEYYYRQNVIVPLVKEILDSDTSYPPIMPMPVDKPAAEPQG